MAKNFKSDPLPSAPLVFCSRCGACGQRVLAPWPDSKPAEAVTARPARPGAIAAAVLALVMFGCGESAEAKRYREAAIVYCDELASLYKALEPSGSMNAEQTKTRTAKVQDAWTRIPEAPKGAPKDVVAAVEELRTIQGEGFGNFVVHQMFFPDEAWRKREDTKTKAASLRARVESARVRLTR